MMRSGVPAGTRGTGEHRGPDTAGLDGGRSNLRFRIPLLLLLFAVLPPGEAAADADDPQPPGRWRRQRITASDAALTDEQRQAMRHLEALGYLSGTRPGPAADGVIRHDAERTSPGLLLVTSAHAPTAHLMDSDGVVLHQWELSYGGVRQRELQSELQRLDYWRRVQLLENGDLLAIYARRAIVRLDARSNLLWVNVNQAHHDLDVRANGDVYVLTRKPVVIDWVNPEAPVLEDYVSILSADDGSEKRRVSILESLRGTPLDGAWNERKTKGDILHTNTVEVLDGRIADRVPGFERGNVLTSFRHLDAIAVVDMESGKAVWTHRGDFRRQHDPVILENGNLLLFDNGNEARGSRVLEIDPASGDVLWQYAGTAESPFWTQTCGTAQRLANGNTLVTESDNGRAFEVTSEGSIVWEYVNPHRAGEEGEFIATLFEVRRLPENFPLDWLREVDAAGP